MQLHYIVLTNYLASKSPVDPLSRHACDRELFNIAEIFKRHFPTLLFQCSLYHCFFLLQMTNKKFFWKNKIVPKNRKLGANFLLLNLLLELK